ncbi:hypothetical protein ABIC75_004462 [Dyella japonica]|uniref:Uncharacterized protein n=1 Tax=Dyella japonica TaxID=231455 RepID=A0ABV2K0W6_9GAMM
MDVHKSNAMLNMCRRDETSVGQPGKKGVTKSQKALPVTSQGNDEVTIEAHADETPEQAAERITLRHAPYSLNEARRIKENYLALLNPLQYDRESGAVVLIDDVTRQLGASYAKVRTRLLAIPAEHAPQMHRLKTVAEVKDTLLELITEAMFDSRQHDVTHDIAGLATGGGSLRDRNSPVQRWRAPSHDCRSETRSHRSTTVGRLPGRRHALRDDARAGMAGGLVRAAAHGCALPDRCV